MREPPPTSREAISARLVWTRVASGLNQTDFCRKVDIDNRTWNNYERGISRISIDEALKVAQNIGVGLDWIYRGDPQNLPVRLYESIKRAREEVELDYLPTKQANL